MSERKKAKKETQLTEKQQRFRRLLAQGGREGALIALVALCIYLMMALVSYSPADPGWVSVSHDEQVTNYAGRTGAWIASLLTEFFGQMGFLFPVMVGFYAFLLVKHRNDPLDLHWPLFTLRFGGFLLILLSATSLLSMYSIMGLDSSAGGVLGREVSEAMVGAFNLPAATLLLVAIFLFALTVFSGLSWFRLMDLLGSNTLQFVDWIKTQFDTRGDDSEEEPKPVKPEPKAPEPRREPPVVNDRVAAEDKPSLLARFKRLFRRKDDSGFVPEPLPARIEPSMDGLAATDNFDGTIDGGFSANESAPVRTAAKPAPKPEKPEPEAKAVRISPFKRKEEARKPTDKERQPSLFDDIESAIPPLTLLDPADPNKKKGYSKESLEHMSQLLEEKLSDFGVSVEVVEVNPGPVITRFEIKPAPGVKVSRISNLAKDLARSLAVISVRVVEVIPGKSVVGIEIPNEEREMVRLREVLSSKTYEESSSPLTLALGNDIGGNPMTANLGKMPHLLVAGTTGSGKSVGVNAMILSMLLKATPDEVRFIMVDPKMLELSIYDGIPHLLAPVVTDMKEAANALRWCVAEMERRYRLMAALGVRNLAGFNRKVKDAAEAGEPIVDPLWKPDEYLDNDEQARPELEPLPFIVVVIDEFADMMMIVGKKVEELIARIAQKARAAGIHLILATQRPSVDVITGLIKANIPTRISFSVQSKIDSRTVLDQGGAEQLLGHGDMLYLPPGSGLPVRVHGAFVDDDEVHRIVSAWKERGEPVYVDDVLSGAEGESLPGVPSLSEGGGDSEGDALYDEAVAFVTEGRRVSISSVQRKFKIGYNRAANLVDAMEASGVVSAAGHNGAREVLAPPPPRD
ncbi:DNA translocase FtsK [Marinobacter nanhaiticus D15-8W]|uniref:DNA translocase FtsK n=1 Tax=Marinobacter nanhaiticus D15-8W TaxID=626887 RepID=N6WRR1_9GAMM|nr:DNA translocase FtsK [Marinobacter nanhaiticus]ENO14211.1 DNA translocase FtsK [Marinobacter nanhaiticus D15-8W]